MVGLARVKQKLLARLEQLANSGSDSGEVSREMEVIHWVLKLMEEESDCRG